MLRYLFNDIPYLPRKMQSAVHKALKDCGEETAKRARAKAPVRTGALRNSIHYELRFPSRSVVILADAPYAVYVEFGTRHMAAQPFLTPAMAEMRGRYGQIVAAAIRGEF